MPRQTPVHGLLLKAIKDFCRIRSFHLCNHAEDTSARNEKIKNNPDHKALLTKLEKSEVWSLTPMDEAKYGQFMEQTYSLDADIYRSLLTYEFEVICVINAYVTDLILSTFASVDNAATPELQRVQGVLLELQELYGKLVKWTNDANARDDLLGVLQKVNDNQKGMKVDVQKRQQEIKDALNKTVGQKPNQQPNPLPNQQTIQLPNQQTVQLPNQQQVNQLPNQQQQQQQQQQDQQASQNQQANKQVQDQKPSQTQQRPDQKQQVQQNKDQQLPDQKQQQSQSKVNDQKLNTQKPSNTKYNSAQKVCSQQEPNTTSAAADGYKTDATIQPTEQPLEKVDPEDECNILVDSNESTDSDSTQVSTLVEKNKDINEYQRAESTFAKTTKKNNKTNKTNKAKGGRGFPVWWCLLFILSIACAIWLLLLHKRKLGGKKVTTTSVLFI